MAEYIKLIGGIIGGGAFLSFLQWLITRHDNKKGKMSLILNKLDKLERDECRTQMLLLMADYQANVSELMRVAEHYFKDIGGDWYMTTMFREYLKNKNINEPYWFTKVKDE